MYSIKLLYIVRSDLKTTTTYDTVILGKKDLTVQPTVLDNVIKSIWDYILKIKSSRNDIISKTQSNQSQQRTNNQND
jgi:chromatin remodeling complex protein RSC6